MTASDTARRLAAKPIRDRCPTCGQVVPRPFVSMLDCEHPECDPDDMHDPACTPCWWWLFEGDRSRVVWMLEEHHPDLLAKMAEPSYTGPVEVPSQ